MKLNEGVLTEECKQELIKQMFQTTIDRGMFGADLDNTRADVLEYEWHDDTVLVSFRTRDGKRPTVEWGVVFVSDTHTTIGVTTAGLARAFVREHDAQATYEHHVENILGHMILAVQTTDYGIRVWARMSDTYTIKII